MVQLVLLRRVPVKNTRVADTSLMLLVVRSMLLMSVASLLLSCLISWNPWRSRLARAVPRVASWVDV